MLQFSKENANEVLAELVKLLGVRVSRQSIDNELESHPHYPSFLAFSDVLNTWKIANAACKVDGDDLHTLPCPFIAHFSSGEHVLVEAIDAKKVKVSDQKWKGHELSAQDFKFRYEGTVLLVEADEESGETDYRVKRRKELIAHFRTPIILGGLSLLFLASFFYFFTRYSFSWILLVLMILKLLGLTTTVILLIQAVDKENPFVQKICNNTKTNCDAILSSPAAKIIDELSWSEIGFFYFAFTTLLLFLNTQSAAVLQAVAFLNVIALPYTFYSIHYQWVVAKQWCVLCCTVQLLLWTEFTVLFRYLFGSLHVPGMSEISTILIAFLIPILIWIFIKPYLLQHEELKTVRQQLRGLKYNFDLFSKLLGGQPKYPLLDKSESILFSKSGAKHTITMVSNPFCDPCSKAHLKLNEWLVDKDDVQLQIVMYTSNNNDDPKTKVVRHMMAIQSEPDDTLLKKAIDDWYKQKLKNYDTWSKAYPSQQGDSNIALQKQREWCEQAKIEATPTFFVNGHKLPKPYKIEDMRYLL